MKKILRFSKVCVWLLCCIAIVSCVDKDYDLDKDIDQEIGFGGDQMAIPVGNTEKITLAKMLESKEGNSILETMPDGTLSLVYGDQLDVNIPNIDPLSLGFTDIFLSEKSLSFPGIAGNKINFVTKGDFKVNENVPIEIVDIDALRFSSGANLIFKINTNVSGANCIGRFDFVESKLIFPDYVILDGGIVGEPNAIMISGNVPGFGSGTLYVPIKIKEFRFSGANPVVNHKIVRSDELKFAPTLEAIGQVAAQQSITVKISADLEMGPLQVSELEGLVDVNIATTTVKWEVEGLPDFLNSPQVLLDVKPYMSVEVSNNLRANMDFNISLNGEIDGSVVQESRSSVDMRVARATDTGAAVWSRYWIASANEGVASGFIYANAPNIDNLFRRIPSVINVAVKGAFSQTSGAHIIDLRESDRTVAVKYSVVVPLKFGSDLAIIYRDTTDFRVDDIDISDYITNAKLITTAKSTIPLSFNLTIKPLDRNHNIVSGVTIGVTEKIKAGGGDSNEVSTDLVMEVKETIKGDLSKVSKLAVEVDANNDALSSNIQLREDQYLKLNMSLTAPGGLVIKNN